MELLDVFDEKTSNKGKQLLETLETFVLDAGMNSSKTSEFLGIHTNTVQYRLKKINDLLGVEITGNRVVPGLTIALALKRLERGII
jgi:DNA-binding PucR family transcriptional regulator